MNSDLIQLAVLSLIAISCGLIGPFLVLKKMVLFANSLSHTILVGILGAYFFASSLWGGNFWDLSTLLIGAFLAAVITSFCTEGLVRVFRLQEDASIGLVFTALFAFGIVLASLYARNLHLGLEAVMGNPDALQTSDLMLSLKILSLNGFCLLMFYFPFKLVCFDSAFAHSLGIKTRFFHFILLLLTSITCVGAFRAVGVLLVLAFLVAPYLTVRRFCRSLPQLLFWCPLIGSAAAALGVFTARIFYHFYDLPLSTAGLVVVWLGVFYFAALYFCRFIQRPIPVK